MITVVGLSHRSAPIEVRERVAIAQDEISGLLREWTEHPDLSEALVLSTCNRVEVVASGPVDAPAHLERVAQATVDCLEARAPAITPHLYRHLGADAVRHLFRVAASLDSLVLGEPQILGQLKHAFDVAQQSGTLGPRLFRTVSRAIRAAKRVRTETAVGRGQVSVPSVAVDLTKQIFGDLRHRTAVLIGAGEMGQSVARLLAGERARLVVVGRDEMRVSEVAAKVGGEPRLMQNLDAVLEEADVVITSTSAPDFVVPYDTVARLHRARRGRSLFFIDLAVPRDVDPRVGDLERVFAYNVDDFARVVAETFSTRQREADLAERIVADEARGFDRWLDATEQVTPAIVSLRSQFDAVLADEIDRTLRSRLKHLGAEDRAALQRMREAALNKLLHGPTVRLREVAQEQGENGLSAEDLVTALQELFEVSPASSRGRARDAGTGTDADGGGGTDESGSGEQNGGRAEAAGGGAASAGADAGVADADVAGDESPSTGVDGET